MKNSLERVETEIGMAPARVGAPFRALGYVVGPLMLATPLLLLAGVIDMVRHHTWSDVPTLLTLFATFGAVCPAIGWKILRAARTGIDPFSEDKVLEATSSQAMLAVVQRNEPTAE